MFKHILIPTDGSKLAEKAVKAGVAFAKEVNAKVTGYCAIQSPGSQIYGEIYDEGYITSGKVLVELQRRIREIAEQHVAVIAEAAKAAGVEFNGVVSEDAAPEKGIIKTAKKSKCDAIFMASHGRRGIDNVILGSITHRVLTHSRIPGVVFR